MRRTDSFVLIALLILLGFPSISNGQQLWSGILAPTRGDANWSSAGATIPSGTIPNCATQPSSNTPAAISAAFTADAGGANYCKINIPAGTYNVSGTINLQYAGKANVILNGAGPNQTFFVWTGGGSMNCNGLNVTEVCVWGGNSSSVAGSESLWTNSTSVNGGYTQGSTTLTLGSFSNLSVGMLLEIIQQDPSSDNGNAYFCATTGSNGSCSWQGASSAPNPGGVNSSQGQLVAVTACGTSTFGAACTSGTVTIDSPIKAPNWSSSQNPTAWWAGTMPVSNVGIQNVSFDVSGITGGIFDECHMCNNVWFQNIRQINGTVKGQSSTNHFIEWNSHHVTIQNSYMYGSNPASEGYGVDFDASTSDSLAQNNITQHVETGYITETGVGNVFGYNYAVDNYFGSNWQQCDEYNHDAGDYYNLFEGNVGICAVEDTIHGSHLWNTYYREYLSGYDPATIPNGPYADGNIMSFQIGAFSRYANIVANVLGNTTLSKPTTSYQNAGASGTPNTCTSYPLEVVYSLNFSDGGNQIPYSPSCIGSSFYIDNDNLAASTLMRWGNYDVVHGSVQENSSETGSSAPVYPGLASPATTFPASFYLSTQPTWWSFPNGSAAPWPAIGPDVTGGNIAGVGGHAWLNPAANCYLNNMGGATNGSSGPLTFNPSTCYPTAASSSGPPAPLNLSGTVVQ